MAATVDIRARLAVAENNGASVELLKKKGERLDLQNQSSVRRNEVWETAVFVI